MEKLIDVSKPKFAVPLPVRPIKINSHYVDGYNRFPWARTSRKCKFYSPNPLV